AASRGGSSPRRPAARSRCCSRQRSSGGRSASRDLWRCGPRRQGSNRRRTKMVRRLACCAMFALALAFVPAALADGPPLYAALGGPGVLSPDGKVRWVTVGDGQHTVLEAVQVADGTPRGWLTLYGGWGIPTIAYGYPGGLS